MIDFFNKFKKKLGPFWDVFAQTWAKINFPGEKALSVFEYSSYLTSCKNSEKIKDPFPRKIPNWRTDGQTDRQGWFYRTLHRTGA